MILQANNKSVKWLLMTSLCTVAAVIGLTNYFGQQYPMFAVNIMNVIIIVPFVAFSLILAARNRVAGSLGKAWICFAVFAVSWSIGEIIWAADEMIYQKDPFPSEADFFWLFGYPAYFVFAMMYIRPFKSSVSTKTVTLAISISVALMGFLVYYALAYSELSWFETALLVSYPIGDAICLAPTLVGFALFFRGQVNFTWLLLLLGMFSFVVADSAYQIISQTDQYQTGHPLDTVYLWAYVFFVFGAYCHIGVFRVRNQENRFNDQQNLR
jgi:hypothetical protein